jgi:hypothetical protein
MDPYRLMVSLETTIPRLFNLKQLAAATGISYYQLRRDAAAGALAHCRVGREKMVTPELFGEYLRGRLARPTAETAPAAPAPVKPRRKSWDEMAADERAAADLAYAND